MSNTVTIYQYDEYAYYTGESRVISIYDPIPKRWTSKPLPDIKENEFAKLFDNNWIIVTQPRPYPSSPPDWKPGGPDTDFPPEIYYVPDSVQNPPEII
jgi:hypothetical protein